MLATFYFEQITKEKVRINKSDAIIQKVSIR